MVDKRPRQAQMRRALHKLMWDRVEAGKKAPQPCPMLSDEDISRELYSILPSASVRRLSEGVANLVVCLLFAVTVSVVVTPILALLVRLARWIAGF